MNCKFPFPASPGEGIKPRECHLAREGSKIFWGQVVGIFIKVYILWPEQLNVSNTNIMIKLYTEVLCLKLSP